jgi:hypothetical protein
MRTDVGRLRVTVSGVRSAYHLVNAHSYLTHLAATDPRPITVDYLGSGTFLGRDNVPADLADDLLGLDGRATVRRPTGADRWATTRGESHVLLTVGVPPTKGYAAMLWSAPTRPPRVIAVDEGLGSYGDLSTRRAAYVRQGGGRLWSSVRALTVTGADRLLTAQRWALYEVNDFGRWQVVEAVAAPIRALSAGSDGPPGRALLLSQPWADLGLMTQRRYLDHLGAMAAACTDAGLRLVIRPHPAEPEGRYVGFEVLQTRGPAELDREVVSADVVLGADSTALLNMRGLWGRPAVRVAMPELVDLADALGPRQRSLLDSFLPPPSNIEELAGVLRSLK